MAGKTKAKPDKKYWLPCTAEDLVVGDAVLYGMLTYRILDGRRLTLERDGKRFEVTPRVQIVGRIVAVDVDANGRVFVIERTTVLDDDYGDAELPPVVSKVPRSVLIEKTARVHRRRSEGPNVRTHQAGREYLWRLLLAAAGGDTSSDHAMERVASCVSAEEIEKAKAEDRHPRRLGWNGALHILRGSSWFPEAVVRQLTGRQTVTTSLPGLQKPIGPADPEIAAIMRMFPGSIVADVRIRKQSDEDVNG